MEPKEFTSILNIGKLLCADTEYSMLNYVAINHELNRVEVGLRHRSGAEINLYSELDTASPTNMIVQRAVEVVAHYLAHYEHTHALVP